ncbi:site-specific DNA-methyltransferase [Epilithonimonas ginsengisoli]|uniref:site-specific DNA-methyltransferase (adenine-specific) n=1 Tax=Epilithonimonas ginsengisoli TaxID=1245592 RepID=A0ABU4JMU5_9FLAO|nr:MULTISPECIES: site-specific DNA-methyltransferase [Chryseobacterium group]MBV6881944.1 site-specific DNA-methyltransferase [Epilithonimonas sp. FP105]MDW8551033.1 site-specific DNA-methyltransferase [Epilithonimonas ginsengisoli]OAH69931.1 DNA methylase N-4 [Chryseobacterium sp. FP211-J200]
MSNKNLQKLELTWIGKGEEPKLEPRILIENPEYSYGDSHTENMLIHGDNLLALKALEQDYAGKVKCIYIDPPYNTGNAFEHYDDGVEHSLWLSLMKPRLEILKKLLSEDGSIWISIDDDESHYLKVLCDMVFGRQNFINNVIWEKKYSPSNDAKWLSDSHDHILVYAKYKDIWRPNLLPRTDDMNNRYKNPDNDQRGPWKPGDVLVKTFSESGVFPVVNPNTGEEFWPPKGSCYRFSQDVFKKMIADNRIYFGKTGTTGPQVKRFLSEVKQGIVAKTLWFRAEVGDNQEAKAEVKRFNLTSVFDTPKPERLLDRILMLASTEGDIVLDSFLGSGTTAAVAHKMGRKYIGIELGDHARTHCYPRLKAVVDGEQGGISKAVNWQGGGGFKFYTLAPSLLKKDRFDNFIISPDYNPDMLAAAMAKQEGFKYQPDEAKFWKQGTSSEQDFIFTTTQFLTVEALEALHDDMQPGESLLICCKAFQQECKNKFANITIKKIPQMLLNRCEFGKDDYSFNIVNLPQEEENEEADETSISVQELNDQKNSPDQPTLFD